MSLISTSSRVYPTNLFGRHNNTYFLHYSSFVTQGSNYNHYGLHLVTLQNNLDGEDLRVVGWEFENGRLEEDFKTNVIRPGLFFTARVVPSSWGRYDAIKGAVVVERGTGKNQFVTLAFEDPFHDYVGSGYKGVIIAGNNPKLAISQLKDHNPKKEPFGSYTFDEFNGRGRSLFEIHDEKK